MGKYFLKQEEMVYGFFSGSSRQRFSASSLTSLKNNQNKKTQKQTTSKCEGLCVTWDTCCN